MKHSTGVMPRLLPFLLVLAACTPQAVKPGEPTPSPAGQPDEVWSPVATPGVARPAPATPSAWSAPETSCTPSSRLDEVMLLNAITERVCPYPKDPEQIDFYRRHLYTTPPIYRLDCSPAEGHVVTIVVRRFAEPSAALAEFDAERPSGPVDGSDGFLAIDWQEQDPSFPGGREEVRRRYMQVGVWVVSIRSFDDTHFLIAPDPRDLSRTIFEVIVALENSS